MSRGREIRCFDYVNHPYATVRDALTRDATAVFQAATKAATARAHSVASQLHASVAGIDVSTDVAISVTGIENDVSDAPAKPATRLRLEWQAAERSHLFPFMQAALLVYPLTGRETQLDFVGTYEPPLGPLGSAVDAIGAHRIADVSVHHFVAEVASYLRTTLAD